MALQKHHKSLPSVCKCWKHLRLSSRAAQLSSMKSCIMRHCSLARLARYWIGQKQDLSKSLCHNEIPHNISISKQCIGICDCLLPARGFSKIVCTLTALEYLRTACKQEQQPEPAKCAVVGCNQPARLGAPMVRHRFLDTTYIVPTCGQPTRGQFAAIIKAGTFAGETLLQPAQYLMTSVGTRLCWHLWAQPSLQAALYESVVLAGCITCYWVCCAGWVYSYFVGTIARQQKSLQWQLPLQLTPSHTYDRSTTCQTL